MDEIEGLVVLCYLPPREKTPDLTESVRAIQRHSRFPVWLVNARHGFPPGLGRVRPGGILLHYSCFYSDLRALSPRFREWLAARGDRWLGVQYQDEQAFTRRKIDLLTEYRVDCVYTALQEPHASRLYGERSAVGEVVSYLPGYVSDRLVAAADRLRRPDADRPIDIGYRGRRLPAHWGELAREKELIGTRFRELAAASGLVLDIELDESKRFRGDAWYRFVASCRGMLGTESGASVLDVDGIVPPLAERHVAGVALDAGIASALADRAEEFPYRTISPRHLEAAAFGTCQILFPGAYAGLLEPDVHYLPLERDFSNLANVLERFRDRETRGALAAAARRDLVDSGALGYPRFVAELDRRLEGAGLRAPGDREEAWRRGARAIHPSRALRRARAAIAIARSYGVPALDLGLARLRSARSAARGDR